MVVQELIALTGNPRSNEKLSIVLPAKNEADGLAQLLPNLRAAFPAAEIVVVDDGSTDETATICARFEVTRLRHPYSMGNGAAIKSGARHARGDVLLFMDADGQHDPDDITQLLQKIEEGYEMAVGARAWNTHASLARRLANRIYNRLASYMTGSRIDDLTSGFRAVRARHFKRFLYLLPNGFSYPATSTMAFFRSGLPVAYVPIRAKQRAGKSHIRLLHDGLRFLMIIMKIGTLFSPMRLFLPLSVGLFLLASGYYGYTFIAHHRFTNMSALLYMSCMLTFLIGVLGELISSLHYKEADFERRRIERDRD
ncbi:MAG: glycosyltransferase family 2 protein [Gammaproteobacteria bacterium]|nr:glycosyltransferase family 2 protein [Gammaproteobacteria bacterium]